MGKSFGEHLKKRGEECKASRYFKNPSLKINKDNIFKMINFDDFKKVDLRAAKILKAEKVDGTDKLLKIEVDVGEEKRQIVSGIAESYIPKELEGKNIVIVYNLKPRKIFGLESQGMLLAVDEEDLSLLVPDKDIAPGAKIS